MKTIILIIPYFGKLPSNFQLWLEGCRFNPSINWLLFIDDQHPYDFPDNVAFVYTSFREIKDRIQQLYDFPIALEHPYKLCDYRVAFGEIFRNEIEKYEYWGYCDIDLLFGNIRKFITDDILGSYEKIGFQGHLTILKNTPEVAKRYREHVEGIPTYEEIFTDPRSCMFDEDIIEAQYDRLQIPVYRKVFFAHLLKYHKDFYLGHLPKEDHYKNKDNIFLWEKGRLYRCYLKSEKMVKEEMLYIHFFCRKMDIKVKGQDRPSRVIIYPNTIKGYDGTIVEDLIKKKAHTSLIIFKVRYLYHNRHKLSFKKVLDYIKRSRKQIRGSYL